MNAIGAGDGTATHTASQEAACFTWVGEPVWPQGAPDAPVLSQPAFAALAGTVLALVSPAGSAPDASALRALITTQPQQPITLAVLDVPVRRANAAEARALAEAAYITGVPPDPRVLHAHASGERVFAMSLLQADQWQAAEPRVPGRRFSLQLTPASWLGVRHESRPTSLTLDIGDGRGPQPLCWSAPVHVDATQSVLASQPSLTLTLIATWEHDGEIQVQRTARCTVPLDGAMQPLADEHWPLVGTADASGVVRTGTAAVYHATTTQRTPRQFVVMCEGFPGGYTDAYMYAMLDQGALATRWRAAGYDVVVVHLHQGALSIEHNASVFGAALAEARARSATPLVAGGVSMGGLVARYALAWHEQQGLDHGARTLLTIDTPHGGAYTAPAAQSLVEWLRPCSPLAEQVHALLQTPANRQFVAHVVHAGQVQEPAERRAFMEALQQVGDWPQRVQRLGVASGHGRGLAESPNAGSPDATEPVVCVQAWPFVEAQLFTSGASPDRRCIATGSTPWTPSSRVTMPPDVPWEYVPGGRNRYLGLAADLAGALQAGSVTCALPVSCSVPTVSALALSQHPALPVPDPAHGASPFHDYVCNHDNAWHCAISDAVADWIVDRTGAPITPSSTHP